MALKVPKQIRTMLSFAPVNVRKIEAWLNDLPKANLGMMSKQLYHAMVELNQLKTTPETRLEIMECLRPSIYYVCHQLSQHFLGQVIVLSPQQRKVANLALTLLYHLGTGYKHVVLSLLAKNKPANDQALLGQAVHRAMSDISHNLLQALQLFAPVPQSIWLEINQLYLIAENKALLNHEIEDQQNTYEPCISIADCYKRIIMLTCSRPNQIRQQNLLQIFHSLELWGKIIQISLPNNQPSEFIISLDTDIGPKHTVLVNETISSNHRAINPTELRKKLQQFINAPLEQREKLPISVPEVLTDEIINHLIKAWGPLQSRSFKRSTSSGKLMVAVGLSATHYYFTGEHEFKDWLNGGESSLTQQQDFNATPDTWSSSFAATANGQRIDQNNTKQKEEVTNQQQTKKRYPIFNTSLINTSPGGYCVNWQGNLPNQLQTGELIGLYEGNSNNWSLAVIRWLKLLSDEQAQLGIELLTPNAKPCAIALLKKTDDDSQFMRGFYIPPIKALSQPANLITPKVPFQVGHKVKLSRGGDIFKGQLVQQITSTGSFSLFEFQGQGTPKEEIEQTTSKDDTDEDFSSLWEML